MLSNFAGKFITLEPQPRQALAEGGIADIHHSALHQCQEPRDTSLSILVSLPEFGQLCMGGFGAINRRSDVGVEQLSKVLRLENPSSDLLHNDIVQSVHPHADPFAVEGALFLALGTDVVGVSATLAPPGVFDQRAAAVAAAGDPCEKGG